MIVTVTLYGWSSPSHRIINSFIPFRSFIISAVLSFGFQIYYFAYPAASLTSKLRSLSFRPILGQDSKLLPGFCRVSPYSFLFGRIF